MRKIWPFAPRISSLRIPIRVLALLLHGIFLIKLFSCGRLCNISHALIIGDTYGAVESHARHININALLCVWSLFTLNFDLSLSPDSWQPSFDRSCRFWTVMGHSLEMFSKRSNWFSSLSVGKQFNVFDRFRYLLVNSKKREVKKISLNGWIDTAALCSHQHSVLGHY